MILLSSLTLFIWNLLENLAEGISCLQGSDSPLPANWRSGPVKYHFLTP